MACMSFSDSSAGAESQPRVCASPRIEAKDPHFPRLRTSINTRGPWQPRSLRNVFHVPPEGEFHDGANPILQGAFSQVKAQKRVRIEVGHRRPRPPDTELLIGHPVIQHHVEARGIFSHPSCPVWYSKCGNVSPASFRASRKDVFMKILGCMLECLGAE
jgi:hypothetical protein